MYCTGGLFPTPGIRELHMRVEGQTDCRPASPVTEMGCSIGHTSQESFDLGGSCSRGHQDVGIVGAGMQVVKDEWGLHGG